MLKYLGLRLKIYFEENRSLSEKKLKKEKNCFSLKKANCLEAFYVAVDFPLGYLQAVLIPFFAFLV
jgi:hypothetical protein